MWNSTDCEQRRSAGAQINPVYLVTNPVTFSEPESYSRKACLAGNGPSLSKRHNAADDRFLARPMGACLCRQCGVAVPVKGGPFTAQREKVPGLFSPECHRIGDEVHECHPFGRRGLPALRLTLLRSPPTGLTTSIHIVFSHFLYHNLHGICPWTPTIHTASPPKHRDEQL